MQQPNQAKAPAVFDGQRRGCAEPPTQSSLEPVQYLAEGRIAALPDI